MYLKQIDIHGFKSFAEKTTLTFLPPKNDRNSLTVVVGPNGSGKSNVSDAIRWVMGEQSMKQLRGKRASDIIFSGSASKGQMSVASVMMTLDNSDGRVPIEFEELVIGRKIYRSGDSEYVINGKVVRLLDLQLLLAKAQFGQGSYAVIGQGMIDKLLLQSAEQRKSFFDEASGIKEFQIKRHQANLRLVRTIEHLAQAEMLLKEIEPRLKTLSRQVKKLEERQEVEHTLRETQEQYYVTLWQYHQSHIDTLQSTLGETSKLVREKERELQQIQEELAKLAQSHSRQDVFSQLQQEYQQIVDERNKKEKERAVLQGKMQIEYSKSGNHQLGWLESKVEELKEKQEKFALAAQKNELSRNEYRKRKQELSAIVDELRVERTQLQGTVATLETKLLQLKTEQSAFRITGFQAVQAILNARQHLSGIHGVVAQLGDVEKRYHLALDTAAGGRLASIVVDDEHSAKAGVEFLRSQKLGVATFLPLTKVRVKDVPYYVEEFIGREGVHGLAQDLIEFDEKYEAIFSLVFGSTLVVEDFETARRIGIGRVRMVTLEGDLFETTGAVKGGYRKERQHGISFADSTGVSSNSLLAEETEQDIENKREQIQSIDEKMADVLLQAQETENELMKQTHAYDFSLEQKAAVDQELAGLEQDLAMQTMSPEQFGSVMEDIAAKKAALDTELDALEKQQAVAQKNIDAFNDEEEKKKQRVFALQDSMQVAQQALNGYLTQKNDANIELTKYQTKQEDLQHELYQELREAIEMVIERGVEVGDISAVDQMQVKIQKLKYKLSLIGGIDQEVVDEYEQTKERFDGLSTEVTDLRKAHTDLTTLIDELDTVMKKKRNKAFKQIKKEFGRYFEILFNGGKADLVEVFGEDTPDEDESSVDTEEMDRLEDDQEAGRKKRKKKVLKGIDIVACPPGKKIQHIQALSGGERTLTSIALMCAILKTNPSPFIVLDEVEAALDEANTLRVVNIIKELADDSQFIIITHNRVTMHAADALYGVTMGNDGMSKLLSVKVEELESEQA